MKLKEVVAANLDSILADIDRAARTRGSDGRAVKLVAVSKKQSPEKMNIYTGLCRERGLPVIFGESYVQEYLAKKDALTPGYEMHLIGNLQSNKAKQAVFNFDCVQSAGTEKLVFLLDIEAKKINKKLSILLQINISADENKGGFSTEDARRFLHDKSPSLSHLEIGGFMTITRFYAEPEDTRADYRRLFKFREEICKELPRFRNKLALSMGMSDDYRIAVEEGADIVRIGTALFGEREA